MILASGPMVNAAEANTVNPAVGRPLIRAEELIKKGNYKEAIIEAQQAARISGLTPYESMLIHQIVGSAEAGAGYYIKAASEYQRVLASGYQTPAEQVLLKRAIAEYYYKGKDYPLAISWERQFLASHKGSKNANLLLAQSYYESGKCRGAEAVILSGLKIAKSSDHPAPKPELEILATCAYQSHDQKVYLEALELLLSSYPNKLYWKEATDTITRLPTFSRSLMPAVNILRFETHTLTTPSGFEHLAEREILVGNPVRAVKILKEGYASGIIKSAAVSSKASRLLHLATTAAANATPTRKGASAYFAVNPGNAAVGELETGISFFENGDFHRARENFREATRLRHSTSIDPTAALAHFWLIASEQRDKKN